MPLVKPTPPTFDAAAWPRLPFPERLRLAAQDWAVNGFGAPAATYSFYLAKLAVYVGLWMFFVGRTPGLGAPTELASWWAEPIAFQKAILWTLAFEGLGFGCASGPLTARYLPPVSAFLHFARPGTIRLPPWPDRVPLTAGDRRSPVDAGLYVLHLALVLRVLLAPDLDLTHLFPVVVVLSVLGLRDKTVFLASRSEHYLTTIVVFLFAGDLIAGSKVVQVAIWWWAATSKLNLHFPAVIAVMLSNHPLLPRRLRRALFRDYPDDLRPSRLPFTLAHAGTVVEYAFPVLLLLGTGGTLTRVGLVVMVAFHLYILTSVPVAVPLEWNVLVIYAGLFLFGAHADVRAWDIDSPLLVAFLLLAVVLVPVVGNLSPARVSFLPSMRYYAGNWGFSWWLFRDDAIDRLDDGAVVTVSRDVATQLERFFDPETATTLMARGMAFRAMHLHGRVLPDLAVRAVDDVERYDIRDGEMIAGRVLGWNFGDGHLHHEQLLAAVQARCGFAPGELRCIFVESQPMGRPTLHWRIVDAADGQLEEGHARVRDLIERQPWPHATSGGRP